MPFAASQDSRTQNTFATATREKVSSAATTWDYSYPTPPQQHTIQPEESATAQAKIAHRLLVLDHVIAPKLATQNGACTMYLKFCGIDPTGLTDEEVGFQLQQVTSKIDAAVTATLEREKKRIPASPGRSLSLPVDVGERDRAQLRWQSRRLWEDTAAREVDVRRRTVSACQSKRVGTQHLPFIIAAIAHFADRKTGHHCTASNLTIAKHASVLASQADEKGHRWRGRRTHRISLTTLARAVGVIVSDLRAIGLIVERARGRHLSAGERVLAFHRHHIYQTKAASVRDLVMPRRFWKKEQRPQSPAWAARRNSFIQPARPSHATPALDHVLRGLRHSALLSPHLHVVQLSSTLTLSRWLLNTLARMSKQISLPNQAKKASRRNFPSISLAAKRLAASLVDQEGMGWLLRHPAQTGRTAHINSLARVLDEAEASGFSSTAITHGIENFLASNKWEFHPSEIRRPLAWLRVVLRQQKDQRDASTALDELAAKETIRRAGVLAC